MKFYLEKPKSGVKAVAEYDKTSGTFTVLKGSIVSKNIAHSEKFRGSKSIEKSRADGVVVDCVVTRDVPFKSTSTAGNFVTGRSTNGPSVWKDKNGKTFKEVTTQEA